MACFDVAVLSPHLAEHLETRLSRLTLLLILLWVVVIGFRPMMDNVDLGWHVAQGHWMVHHLAFYRADAFNYPNVQEWRGPQFIGNPVIDEYPLFQVVLYGAWSLGWWGPCLLTAIIYGLLGWLLLRAAKEFRLETSALFCLCVGLMFLYLQVAFPLRPHMITYLAIAVLGIWLLRHRDATRWTLFWPMALLQIAWTNCHSGFVIGPAMVALFGFEMILRRWIATKAFPWTTIQTWLGAFLLILLACFINPYGWSRFYLPFYQDQLESIRAYVGEMEPLSGGRDMLFGGITTFAGIAVVLGLVARKGATAYGFLLLAIVFYLQAQSVQKAWPIFGVFLPLVILGSGAFSATLLPRKAEAWLNVLGHFFVATTAAIALGIALDRDWPSSIPNQWREYDHGRSEISVVATQWMLDHHLRGRLLLHRCEDGGWLQQAGFDNAETFADTGFGKYSEDLIHEVCLASYRPALVPRFLAAYHPVLTVCSNFCYDWPYYLRQSGRRLIFYSPNSSVWTQEKGFSDFPTVTNEQIMAAFDSDIAANGLPMDKALLGRNILALNSLGLEDFAFAKLIGLPEEFHHASWYWEAARFLCFAEPAFSPAHRDALLSEAESLHDDELTAEFRAYHRYYASGNVDGALQILESIPRDKLGNYAAELLLKIYLDRKRPEALALARRTDCFDLRNGRHWQYLAQAQEEAGNLEAARAAWKKAVFYYPDDATLMDAATAFAARNHDLSLTQAISESAKRYGQPGR